MPISITGNNHSFGPISEGDGNIVSQGNGNINSQGDGNVNQMINFASPGTTTERGASTAPSGAASSTALLNRKEREMLIEQLMQLPNIRDPRTRELLLIDLPANLKNAIPASAAPRPHIIDIVMMADSDAWRTPADSNEDWPLLIVIDNAFKQVAGSNLGKLLQGQLTTLRARTSRR